MTKKLAEFLGRTILDNPRTKFEFVPAKHIISGGIRCTGEADQYGIKIATGAPAWLEVFVHETCHLDQHKERRDWFEERNAAVDKLSRWLEGKTEVFRELDLWKILELERDCERRVIKKIRKHRLPIDQRAYAQKANAYLMSYFTTVRRRKWASQAYNNRRLCATMPDRLYTMTKLKQKFDA